MIERRRYIPLWTPILVGVLVLGSLNPCPSRAQSSAPWAVRLPDTFSLDRSQLAEAFEHAETLVPLNSLLIARHGTLVAEQYFRGMRANKRVNIKSASKSILSALVGIALEEGALDSLDQPIASFFPEYLGPNADPRKRQITLRNLLTMRAGLESTSFGNYGAWVTSDNWIRYVLNQPIVQPPGDGMIYSTGTSHLVSAILTKATGMSTRAYAVDHLFEPLGVRPPTWQQDPQGYYFGGNNMALTPRALWRFGQLYLDDGRFRGRQILPPDWVRASTGQYVFETRHGYRYGYFWWTEILGGVRTHFAWGYGGQYVFVIPALDLVVVCTSALSNRSDGFNHNARILNLLETYILPAVHS